MFSACGNSVQNTWVSGLLTCSRSSTELRQNDQQIYEGSGKLTVTRFLTGNNPCCSTQVKNHFTHLLISYLSLLSTAPIITNTKNFKEI